jgi:hypothetical protein
MESDILPIIGLSCSRCSIDYSVTLIFLNAGKFYELVFENKFTLEDKNGSLVIIDIANDIRTVLPVFKLLFKMVTDVTVSSTGTLIVNFEEGLTVQVEADSHYEPWGFVGSDGYRVVCSSTGELAIWSSV